LSIKGYDADPVSFREGKAVIASSAGASKGTGVLDIALTSGRGGAVSHDTICGLLTKCLQDVSSVVLAMLCLFTLLLNFLLSLFLHKATKLTRAVRTIIVEDSRASLRRRVTELEKDKDALQ
jgi:hypothetical protein